MSMLEGRRALVTGAASGIGLAVAEELARLKVSVVLSDIEGAALQQAAAKLSARAIPADLSVREDVDRLAKDAGEIDILINNAGLQHVSAIEDFDPAMWDRLLAVMLTAPFLLMRSAVPSMYRNKWGRVVNVASVHGLVASPYKSAYVTAKHGILGLTKTAALEAAAKCAGVTVNAVCPSYVRTPLVEKQIRDQARMHGVPEDEVVSRILLTQNAVKRLIEPSEVARSVVYLCQDEAWSVTGTALTMDAGWLAH
ncbi:MAG: 3-hydroxybutyrate dehydrogenase [Polyangiales bacterium]